MKHSKNVLLTYSRIIFLDCQEQTILRGHEINSCVTKYCHTPYECSNIKFTRKYHILPVIVYHKI